MRKDIVFLILTLLIVDISVLMDISPLRQSLPFIAFSILPGYLFLSIIHSDLKGIEKFLTSVSLSIFLLYLIGLIINSMYPILKNPISFFPIFVALNILFLILIFLEYLKGEEIVLNFEFKFKKYYYLILFLFAPLLVIIGSYMMNVYSNNSFLLLSIFLISCYLVLLTLYDDKVPTLAFPMALMSISLSLLLMNSLPSNYLIGRDIHWEYYEFKRVLINHRWLIDTNSIRGSYNACLSITILPCIYKLILNVPAVYILKVYYGFFGSILPLSVYAISKKIFDSKLLAFYASTLFIFQFYFVFLLGFCRQLLALLFFSNAILLLLLNNTNELHKRGFILIFMVSTVFSHYTTSYIFFIIVFIISLLSWILKRFNLRVQERGENNFTLISSLFFFAVLFGWYAQMTSVPFYDFIGFIKGTLINMTNFLSNDLRAPETSSILSTNFANIPNAISVIVHNIMFIIIGIGVISISRDIIFEKHSSNNYLYLTLISSILLMSFVLLPYVSVAYGAGRLFTQLLIILAPAFIIGTKNVACIMTKFKFSFKFSKFHLEIPMILTFLLILFSCITYLNYYAFGIPYSYAIDDDGERRYEAFIYDGEVKGAQWLYYYGKKNGTICSDYFGYSRIIQAFDIYPKLDRLYFRKGKRLDNVYIYLRQVNLNGLVFIDAPINAPIKYGNKIKMDNVDAISNY